MNTRARIAWRYAALALITSLLAGCLERKETLTVRPDGSVAVRHVIEGNLDDLDFGAAGFPSSQQGFNTRRRTTRTDDGSERGVLEADGDFKSVVDLPDSFVAGDPQLAAAALKLDTELEIVRENERTYYRFTRRYSSRAWGDYAAFLRQSITPESRRRIETPGFSFDELELKQQCELIAGFVDYERRKIAHWVAAALDATTLPARARDDARMDLDRVITDWFSREVDVAKIVKAIVSKDESAIDAMTKTIHEGVAAVALEESARILNLDANARRHFRHAYALARQAFEVTEDLSDENFVVRVELPGRIVRHEGGVAGGNAVEWRIAGEDLRDRDVVLRAVSVVEE